MRRRRLREEREIHKEDEKRGSRKGNEDEKTWWKRREGTNMSGFSQKSFFEEKGSFGGLKRDRFDLKLQKKSDAAHKMIWRIGFKDVKDKNKIDRYLVLL